MTNETIPLGASATATKAYTYHSGASGGLGVMTQEGASAAVAQWKAALDAFSRVSTETNSVIHRTATGTVSGAASVRGYLQSDLNFPAFSGDKVYLWNGYTNVPYQYQGTGWTPSEPYVNVGDGFWSEKASGMYWTNQYSPW